MLNWLASAYADWKQRRRDGIESEAARGADADGVSDEPDSEETDVVAAAESEPPEPDIGLLGGDEVSKQEVQVELGLQPHEFLAWLVRASGGRMWQADVVETTGWSKSTVSRYLDTLESNGIVERVRIGRRKLVGLPEQMPDMVRTTDGPSADSPPPEMSTGSWTPEANERA